LNCVERGTMNVSFVALCLSLLMRSYISSSLGRVSACDNQSSHYDGLFASLKPISDDFVRAADVATAIISLNSFF